MKNIHLIPTDKPSKLHEFGNIWFSHKEPTECFRNYNIYITSDEEIKDVRPHNGKWQLEKGQILNKFPDYLTDLSECKLVILTTDPELIAEGIQPIDDTFLEWFVNNPSCEKVEVRKWFGGEDFLGYKIIIPKEDRSCNNSCSVVCGECQILEIKQETLEEAAINCWAEGAWDNRDDFTDGFVEGAKWQQERMYSEEDIMNALHSVELKHNKDYSKIYNSMKEWFEQFKKK